MTPFQVLKIDMAVKRRLVQKLREKGELFTFDEDPALASLCTCLGLEFELGNRAYDRLSPFFGVEIDPEGENPWNVQIISKEEKIGLILKRRDGLRPQIRHADFRFIIDPLSFEVSGELTRIVIFPSDVARNYKRKGFELVIVRDWILGSALSIDEAPVSYLIANPKEIASNIALVQARMVAVKQLAFSGTHDIVDHLLQSDEKAFERNVKLFQKTSLELQTYFGERTTPSREELFLSYLVGVLLDDMAQPKWYSSNGHSFLIESALHELRTHLKAEDSESDLTLPKEFHVLMAHLRSQNSSLDYLAEHFQIFVSGFTPVYPIT